MAEAEEESVINPAVMLTNLSMRLTVKPLLRFAGSIRLLRAVARVIDHSLTPIPMRCELLPVAGHNCQMEWISSAKDGEDGPVLLYLPGGAFMVRTPNTHRKFVCRIARAAGARSLLVFYRLAPEHPFPAGLDDAVAAYQHLLAEGVSSQRIVVAGDSSGGGLAVSTLLRLKERDLPMPAGLISLSPLADMSHVGASRIRNRFRDPMLSDNRRLDQNRLYLGNTPPDNPVASPVYADLSGFPPMLMMVSDNEILLDDTLRLVENARKVAVSAELTVGKNLPHVWPAIGHLKEGRAAIRQISDFVDRVTRGQRKKYAKQETGNAN